MFQDKAPPSRHPTMSSSHCHSQVRPETFRPSLRPLRQVSLVSLSSGCPVGPFGSVTTSRFRPDVLTLRSSFTDTPWSPHHGSDPHSDSPSTTGPLPSRPTRTTESKLIGHTILNIGQYTYNMLNWGSSRDTTSIITEVKCLLC